MVAPSMVVRAGGLVFLLLGGAWASLGLWLPSLLLVAVGGLIAVAGTVLLGLAPRIADRDGVGAVDSGG